MTMVVKVSSKRQVTIPKGIADVFNLKKGDVVEMVLRGHQIILSPKEVIYEDKYPQEDLKVAEEVLSKGLAREEIAFESGDEMVRHFQKRTKK